jgi:filamentous hemagglutinin family protein
MSDVLITPASKKIEFKDSSSNIDGKIELDGNDNLVLTSTNDLVLGDGSTD